MPPAKKTTPKAPKTEIVPLKIVGQVIAARVIDGQVADEVPVGDLVLFRPHFDELRARIDESWPRVVDALGS